MTRWLQIVDACCRDLRRFLEESLAKSKGGVVTVKMRRLLRVELSLPDRAVCAVPQPRAGRIPLEI